MVDKEIEEIINKLKESKAKLIDVSMRDILEASTGQKVIPYSVSYKSVITELRAIGAGIIDDYSTKPITREIYDEYRGRKGNAFRNNEVGDFCEHLIKEKFDKNKKKFKNILDTVILGSKGYPDLELRTSKGTIYLEVKATSRPDTGSPRDFFYSVGGTSEKKVNKTALHVLIGFFTKQIGEGQFQIKGFELVDVSKIKVGLKPEFNTDNLGIYSEDTIIR